MAKAGFSFSGKKIWVAGETGLVGRALGQEDVCVLSAPRVRLDLMDQKATFDWIAQYKPDLILMAAAKVGGIGANSSYPADFIRDNLSIAMNVIEGAHRADVSRLVFLGSSCIYPKHAEQPIREDALMTGPLEETNEAYAVAKIAGLKLCQFYKTQFGRDYVSVMPTNLYGPHDRFDAENSHVIPAMILKFMRAIQEKAPSVTLWGTGAPLREFLHVDDLAAAVLHVARHYHGNAPVNIGSGEEVSIATLAHAIKDVTGYKGEIVFDLEKPDGTPRKSLDSSKMRAMGWRAKIALRDGLEETLAWYEMNTRPTLSSLRA